MKRVSKLNQRPENMKKKSISNFFSNTKKGIKKTNEVKKEQLKNKNKKKLLILMIMNLILWIMKMQ